MRPDNPGFPDEFRSGRWFLRHRRVSGGSIIKNNKPIVRKPHAHGYRCRRETVAVLLLNPSRIFADRRYYFAAFPADTPFCRYCYFSFFIFYIYTICTYCIVRVCVCTRVYAIEWKRKNERKKNRYSLWARSWSRNGAIYMRVLYGARIQEIRTRVGGDMNARGRDPSGTVASVGSVGSSTA